MKQPTLLCIASYEKGQVFLQTAAEAGCRVLLLTADKLEHADWPRGSLAGLHRMPNDAGPEQVLRAVQAIARHEHIDGVVPLDEFDLEAAALVREELRLPGMGQTATRLFRDKLAMRVRAESAGFAVPEFVAVLNHDDLHRFTQSVPAPWLLKPRTSASAIGIRRIENAVDLWRALDELGERQTDFLLERFAPGDVFHVDSICWGGKVIEQSVQQYGTTPMSLMQGGGVFTTRTLDRESQAAVELRALDAALVPALGMTAGVTHTEYIRSAGSGRFLFLETAARVGGAYIAELVEFASGANPWREWARIEAALLLGLEYLLPPLHRAYAGSVICLARQPWPDLTGYRDSEVVLQIAKHHHAGLIVRSGSAQRVETLLREYHDRFLTDFCASMPPPDKPTS